MTAIQTAPAPRRPVRSDASQWRIVAGKLQPGEWVVVPECDLKDVRNRTGPWRSECGLAVRIYRSQDGRNILLNSPSLPPRETLDNAIQIRSDTPPGRVARGRFLSPHVCAAEELKPGQWFEIVGNAAEILAKANSIYQWRYRAKRDDIRTYKTAHGSIVVMREPSPPGVAA